MTFGAPTPGQPGRKPVPGGGSGWTPPAWRPGPPHHTPHPPGFPRPVGSRRRAGALITLLLASALLAGVAVVLGFALSDRSAPLAEPAIEPPGAGQSPTGEYVKEKSEVLLDRSARGLLANDRDQWLSAFAPDIHDDMEGRFASLRALQVSSFDYQVIDEPRGDGERWEVTFGLNYCFGGEKDGRCAPTGMILDIAWEWTGERLLATEVMESETPPREDSRQTIGARPWEVQELRAEAGDRAVVAATGRAAEDFDVTDTLEIAESAASNADEYAVFGEVDKYVVFMGSDEDIAQWYGLGDSIPSQAIGFALPLPQIDEQGDPVPGGSEVVLFAERLKRIEERYGAAGRDEFESTLRHELGHVATLHHSPQHTAADVDADWWLAEGTAELIDHGPHEDLDGYSRKEGVKDYLASDDWDGELTAPTGPGPWGSAKYGIAFYWSYYLYNEYGKDAFMDFFERVVRNGDSPQDASSAALGASYGEVLEACDEYVNDEVL